MKQITLAALLGALALTAAAQAPDSVRIPASAARIVPPEHPYRMNEGEFYAYTGAYDLSNGKTLYLFGHGYHIYAEVGREGKHRIVPASANTFVAADGQLKLHIDLRDDGSVAGELTMVVPADRLSEAGTGERLMVAAFR